MCLGDKLELPVLDKVLFLPLISWLLWPKFEIFTSWAMS